jgi:hypothetical protein
MSSGDIITLTLPANEIKLLERFETIKGCGKKYVYKFFVSDNSIIYTENKEFEIKQNIKVHTEKYPNEWFLLVDNNFNLNSGEVSDTVIDFDEEVDKNRSKYTNIYFDWKSDDLDDSDYDYDF